MLRWRIPKFNPSTFPVCLTPSENQAPQESQASCYFQSAWRSCRLIASEDRSLCTVMFVGLTLAWLMVDSHMATSKHRKALASCPMTGYFQPASASDQPAILSCKSTSIVTKSVPFHSEISVSSLKEVTLPFPRALLEHIMTSHTSQEVTRMSCDNGSLTR